MSQDMYDYYMQIFSQGICDMYYREEVEQKLLIKGWHAINSFKMTD